MRIYALVLIFAFFISCKNSDDTRLSGAFENTNIIGNKPVFILFQKDSIVIKLSRDVNTIKVKLTYTNHDSFYINADNQIIDFKILKFDKNDITLLDKMNIFSFKDTVHLKRIKDKENFTTKINIEGFWYSDDFIISKSAQFWLKFDNTKLSIRYKDINLSESFQEFNYNIEEFGKHYFLNIPFSGNDAVLMFDDISKEQIQFYTNDLIANSKYFVHLHKIDSIEFINLVVPKVKSFSIDNNQNRHIESE